MDNLDLWCDKITAFLYHISLPASILIIAFITHKIENGLSLASCVGTYWCTYQAGRGSQIMLRCL